jgi:RNA polymerase sigma factor (TIGR02999 family)
MKAIRLVYTPSMDRQAFDHQFAEVYGEIRRLARRELRATGRSDTLNTTALVHEAYLKLARHPSSEWEDRAHFFAVAGRALRQVLVDSARGHLADKRGGGAPVLSLDDVDIPAQSRATDILELDHALERLAGINERLCRLVELRFFVGLQVEEIAELLGVNERTLRRDWVKARAFLYRELEGGGALSMP